MPTSPKDMMDATERNLPARTGKTLAQWVALVKRGGPRDRRERVAWLRKESALRPVHDAALAAARKLGKAAYDHDA